MTDGHTGGIKHTHKNTRVDKPEWRLKNSTGGDVMAFPVSRGVMWCYNLTNPDMRAYWVNECVEAAKKGCTGCFIDQANVAEGVAGWPRGSPVVAAYAKAHMLAQTELAEALKPTDNYAIYNHLGAANYSTTAMMIEDFVGTDTCVRRLQTIASRGLAIQAHAGDLPKSAKWGGTGKGNQCIDGDTNSLAARSKSIYCFSPRHRAIIVLLGRQPAACSLLPSSIHADARSF